MRIDHRDICSFLNEPILVNMIIDQFYWIIFSNDYEKDLTKEVTNNEKDHQIMLLIDFDEVEVFLVLLSFVLNRV